MNFDMPIEMAGSVQVRLVTPAQATTLLAQCAFPRQRPLRPHWVDELAGILCQKEWATTTITLAACREDGRVYVVDGYHRLSAIVRAEHDGLLIISLETLDTFEDVCVLYTRLDNPIPRTMRDRLIACDATSKTDLPVTTLKMGMAAVNVINHDFKNVANTSRNRGYDANYRDLNEWIVELRRYITATEQGQKEVTGKMRGSAYMAVGLALMKHQPEKAFKFFHSIATNNRLEVGTPQHVLYSKIISREAEVRKVGVAVVCRYTAFCWNAYYEGRNISFTRVYDPSKPIWLLGTPYTRHIYNETA